MTIVKVYLGISLELLWAVWDQLFQTRNKQVVPCSGLYLFSRSLAPRHCLVNFNYRVLICCTCHFQSRSLFFVYFGFLCFQVSSVSYFHPDTRGRRWLLISAHLFSCVVGRKGCCKQISLACVGSVRSVWTTLDLPQLKAPCASWVYTAQAPGCSAGALSKACHVFHALPRSKLLRFRFLGTPQGHRLGWACVLCLS